MKTVGASLKTELQSGAPVVATCWKIERQDGTIFGFTDWPESFLYSGLTYNSSGGYQRTAIDQREGLSVDNMDVVGVIDSSFITVDDLLAGDFRGAKVWIFAISPPNLGWGDIKLDYGVLGEIHIGEIHFVAEFRSLVTKLSQEFGDKFSRYCRHKLGSSDVSSGVETKCGVVLESDDWVVSTAYDVDDQVAPPTDNGRQFIATTGGTSIDNADADVASVVNQGSPLAFWRLADSVADTNWSSVKALFHMDGTNGSTTITEETGKTATAVGNAQIKTANGKFDQSLYLDGTGDYVTLPDSTDWQWSTGTYTVECFVYIEEWPGVGLWDCIVSWHLGSNGWRLLYDDDERLHLATNLGGAGGFMTANGTLSLNTWHHIAFCIDGTGKVQAFIDGAHVVVDGAVTSCNNAVTTLKIGTTEGSTMMMKGYVDELRITKGVQRYSAAFTPQKAPYQTNTARVWDFSNNGHLGTLVNTPTFETTAITGIADATCCDFQSADTDSLNVDDADFDNLFDAGGTISGWASCDTGSTGNHMILCKDAGTASATDNYGGWAFMVDATNSRVQFYFRFADGVSSTSNGRWYTPTNSITLGTAFHWAVTMTATDGDDDPKIYIDGVEQTLVEDLLPTSAHTPKSDSDSVLYIGQRDTSQSGGAGASAFDGKIQDVIVHDRVLDAGEIGSLKWLGDGREEPPWNVTVGATTYDGPVRWETIESYTKVGTVTAVTSDYKFTASALPGAVGAFQYGVLTWLTGDNAGKAQDVKKHETGGVLTLRQVSPRTIQIGDTFKVHIGCNHILKMPADTLGSPYTGDCRVKFNNVKNFGGEPELPNIDRVAAPAGGV